MPPHERLVFRLPDRSYEPQRVFCIGRNYAEHVKELGNAPSGEPVVFMKPPSALVPPGEPIVLPRGQGPVHHELELVLLVGREGRDIPAAVACEYLAGATLGLDLTLRAVQEALKRAGHPWERAKAFDGSAPLGTFRPAGGLEFDALELRCEVNGELRQHGNTRDMLFPVPTLVAWLSRHWRLLPGDVIYTGTPPGVGPLEPGDRVRVASPALGAFEWHCT
ncbi:MAG TPA: fumarylacetoacetate hydrolase family protein [Gammaproteobacteria bacterium]|nr:fumarylacetoacetate hydrolase family protein [Gammaproteobacteria bacterium]